VVIEIKSIELGQESMSIRFLAQCCYGNTLERW